jgi:hypothetical protein
MTPNPYAWDADAPSRPVPRREQVKRILDQLRRGAAVKVIGGRGMGKSVLLRQLEVALSGEPGTRAVRIPGPPDELTVPAALQGLTTTLGLRDLTASRVEDVLDQVLRDGASRLVLLFDEADQYVSGGGAFARSWFNKLEVVRKERHRAFNVVVAGGLGLLYLEHELGSGLISRASSYVLAPFSADEVSDLATPFYDDGRALDEACLATLVVLSGGSPALVTYGLERLWDSAVGVPRSRTLEGIFGAFRDEHDSFIRGIHASVSQRSRLDAPWRVLEAVRRDAGAVPARHLREASAPGSDVVRVDHRQALELLRAAGLVRLDGSALADPVSAWPIASILNLPETAASAGSPVDRLTQDVSAVLANMRRFGRDFHQGHALLHEEVFSSVIAVGLRLLGWDYTEREAVQAAGFTDLKVRPTQSGFDGHAIIETKIWRGPEYNQGIQQQLDAYRVADTRHGIAVTLGDRGVEGWAEAYEVACLTALTFERLAPPPDLVARWRVTTLDGAGLERFTDHLLVQLPKRR